MKHPSVPGRASAPRCHGGPSAITPFVRDGDGGGGTAERSGTARDGTPARAGTGMGTVPVRGGPVPTRVGTAGTAGRPGGDGRGRRERTGPAATRRALGASRRPVPAALV